MGGRCSVPLLTCVWQACVELGRARPRTGIPVQTRGVVAAPSLVVGLDGGAGRQMQTPSPTHGPAAHADPLSISSCVCPLSPAASCGLSVVISTMLYMWMPSEYGAMLSTGIPRHHARQHRTQHRSLVQSSDSSRSGHEPSDTPRACTRKGVHEFETAVLSSHQCLPPHPDVWREAAGLGAAPEAGGAPTAGRGCSMVAVPLRSFLPCVPVAKWARAHHRALEMQRVRTRGHGRVPHARVRAAPKKGLPARAARSLAPPYRRAPATAARTPPPPRAPPSRSPRSLAHLRAVSPARLVAAVLPPAKRAMHAAFKLEGAVSLDSGQAGACYPQYAVWGASLAGAALVGFAMPAILRTLRSVSSWCLKCIGRLWSACPSLQGAGGGAALTLSRPGAGAAPRDSDKRSGGKGSHRDSTTYTYVSTAGNKVTGSDRMSLELCMGCIETNRLLRKIAADTGQVCACACEREYTRGALAVPRQHSRPILRKDGARAGAPCRSRGHPCCASSRNERCAGVRAQKFESEPCDLCKERGSRLAAFTTSPSSTCQVLLCPLSHYPPQAAAILACRRCTRRVIPGRHAASLWSRRLEFPRPEP